MIIGDFRGMSKGVRFISYGIMAVCILVVILLLYSIVSDNPVEWIFGNQTANNTGTTGTGTVGTSGGTTGSGTGVGTVGTGSGGTSGGSSGGTSGGTSGTGTTGGNPPGNNNTNQTYLACVNNTCSIVNGSGTNQCLSVGMACNQTVLVQCNDGIDNDLDGAVDLDDFSCYSFNEGRINLTESTYSAQCQDGIDNDNDSLIDYPADSGCANNQDNLEDSGSSNAMWEKLNGGLSLGDDELLSFWSNYNHEVVTVREDNGDVLYFYNDKKTFATYVGKFSIANKKWQGLTFSGWSSQGIQRPFSENNWAASRVKIFNHPTQDALFGTIGASSRMGSLYLDTHGSAYAFRFDNQNIEYWNTNGWNKYQAQVLGYSYRGASGYGHDSDFSSNTGMIVETAGEGDYGLSASKYSFAANKWDNWNNGWSQNLNSVSLLPYYEAGTSLNNPVVRNIKGTEDYIVTFIQQSQGSSIKIKALRYDSAGQRWLGWNNNAWTQTGAGVVYSGPEISSYRPSFVQNNVLRSLFLDGSNLIMLSYNLAIQTWTNENVASGVSQFESAENGNEILVIYKSGNKLYKKVFLNNVWSGSSEIYSSAQNINLAGLDFAQGNPMLFYIENINGKDKLFVLGDNSGGYWNNEIPRQADTPVLGNALSVGQYTGEFDTEILIEIPNPAQSGQTISGYSAYGNIQCGNMALDSQGRLYCPKLTHGSVGIFPKDYVPNLTPDSARSWGSLFEYFMFPSGVAVDETRGKVYIADQISLGGGGSLGATGRLQIWDYSKVNNHLVYRLGFSPTTWFNPPTYTIPYTPEIALTGLAWPGDVETDNARGFLYIVETKANQVRKYNLDSQGRLGTYTTIGSEGSGDGEFMLPQSAAIDNDGNLYVVDSGNHRIQKFNSEGNFLAKWGNVGHGNGNFVYPQFIAVDKTKRYIYVSDTFNNRIQIFNSEGVYVSSFSSWTGGNVRSIERIGGMAAGNNNLWVSVRNENGASAVVIFQMTLL